MKRIVCVLLTLIMLLSLVPMGASAASYSTSAAAITVLKQMTSFKSDCYHFTGSEFRIGYGTVCDRDHSFGTDGKPVVAQGVHSITEAKADAALREALKELDKKVDSFATSNGKALTQAQHDALVVFSYNAGTDWMNGNGVVKTAILNNADASELLNAMDLWTNNADINRRKVEVNMYMNGIYSNTVPSNYGQVTYNANGGYIAQGSPYTMYYDTAKTIPHITAPTHATKRFVGWYTAAEGGTWIPVLTKKQNGETLYAHYMALKEENSNSYKLDASYISPKTVYKNDLKTVNSGKLKLISGKTTVEVKGEKLDGNGNRWAKLENNAWVKIGTKSSGYVDNAAIISTVTVTNAYVNRRVNATATSAKNGTYKQGEQLNIIAEDDGWLQVGEIKADGSVKAVGWVASVYTNWGSAQEVTSSAESTNVIGTAIVTFDGYLNIRQEPGTDGKIVGALAKKDTVDVYEIKTVNGHRWGRINSGWICLTYTSLTTLENAAISDEGMKLYAFTGKVVDGDMAARVAAGESTNQATYSDATGTNKLFIKSGKAVTVTNLVVVNGDTWAKATWKNDEYKWKDSKKKEKVEIKVTRSGWVKLSSVIALYTSDNGRIELDPVKYNVAAETVNVRIDPDNQSGLAFVLNKGTQVEVNEIVLNGENIWGLITVKDIDGKGWTGVESNEVGAKVGWINLATKYVTRDDVPTVEEESHDTGKIGTVINTDALKVRKTSAAYAAQIGTLSRGTSVAIWESDDGWYKVDSNQNGTYDYEGDGWVSGKYLEVSKNTAGTSSTVTDAAGNKYETDGTGKGVVANTYGGLNVRQGAGIGYAPVGKLLPGTIVEILETSANGKWGRTAQGWVSMDYITMVSYNEVVNTPTDGTTVGSYADAQKTTTTAVYTGTLQAGTPVYRTPEVKDSEVIRTTKQDENVTIYELATVTKNVVSDEIDKTVDNNTTITTTTTTTETTYWARINDGWVQTPENCIWLNALDEKIHTQTHTATLKVRSVPETGNVIDALAQGDQVSVTALQIVKDKVWGRIETDEGTGWIRLDYMSEGVVYVQAPVQNNNNTTVTQPTIGAGSSTGGFVTNTSGYRYTGNVIRTNELNVRSTPSTTASKTTTLKNGQALVIYETMQAENMAWGRCDAGWVYLYYVDLVPVTGGVDARVVANDNTVAYTDMNCTAVAGTYSRQSVVDIFEIVGKMARTDLGWVNVDNLL